VIFGRKPVLPVTPEERAWIEGAFERLQVIFGAETLRQGTVIAPKDDFFPEWNGDADCVAPLLRRVCGYLQADPDAVEARVVNDGGNNLQNALLQNGLVVKGRTRDLLSLGDEEAEEPRDRESAKLVRVKDSLLPYPIALIGHLAREVATHRLIDERHVPANDKDVWGMIELTTIFFGLGIFPANSSVRYEQNSLGRTVQRAGYITQPQWGHALAEFARIRGEAKPPWARFLSDDIGTYFKASHAVLCREAR